MGDHPSSPVITDNQQITPKLQSYTHQMLLPGSPLTLKIAQSTENSQSDSIDLYNFEAQLSEEEAARERQVYVQRKNSLPWHVKVLAFRMEKDACYCSNHKYCLDIYTEHVQSRLSQFRFAGKPRHIQHQKFDSLSLNQGIYVLISALHAYQLLRQRFRVSYPTAQGLGINKRGQVKVWVSDNWATNRQSIKPVSQNLFIEEILSLVDERTEGSLAELVDSRHSYMTFTFDTIQQMLAQYTINFSQGRKSLQKKIQQQLSQPCETRPKKYSLTKSKQEVDRLRLSMTSAQVQPPNSSKTQETDRDKYQKLSREGRAENMWQSTFLKKVPTPKTSVNQSARTVNFTYEPQPMVSRPLSSRVFTGPTFINLSQHDATLQSLYFPSEVNLVESNSLIGIPRQTFEHSKKAGNNHPGQSCQNRDESVIKSIEVVESKKCLRQRGQGSRTTKQVHFNQQETNTFFTPPQSKEDVDKSDLESLTSEFRILLQSDKLIKGENEQELQSYNDVMLSLGDTSSNPATLKTLEYSDQILPSPLQPNFYSIKEVDEQVSYSVDQNK